MARIFTKEDLTQMQEEIMGEDCEEQFLLKISYAI